MTSLLTVIAQEIRTVSSNMTRLLAVVAEPIADGLLLHPLRLSQTPLAPAALLTSTLPAGPEGLLGAA